MKKVLGIVLLGALTGCASSQSVNQTNAEVDSLRMKVGELEARVHALTRRPTVPAPREHYCYINGQQFSKGTIISGRICETQPGSGGELQWGFHD
ncbi:hypothetical protein [Salinicola sp. NYA28a]